MGIQLLLAQVCRAGYSSGYLCLIYIFLILAHLSAQVYIVGLSNGYYALVIQSA